MTRAELKYYTSLTLKKSRMEEAKFLVEGIKLIGEAISSGYYCEAIFYKNQYIDKIELYLQIT